MRWELRVTLRDGRTAGVLFESRAAARTELMNLTDTMVDDDSYWLTTPDSQYLILPEDFWGAEITKFDAP